ncbi:phenazine antibiotic biosynthesis protein [Ktedonospora formicarum]|uniref:Phenazine antibiotic biosynthesis protein n=1 Tax=Ktedonospora formicarum TaxID=2778364 RepID=A0A8J3MU40_9CHLR|nr:phenazine antibiotic biosynthesis protein [Ktedonospora formicarum]GHO47815.1 phenazine antibiotic biosynthesis protein [Ktedonospora formicarum]
MTVFSSILDLPLDARVDPQEFLSAAMEWHFNPETGSAYWLERAKSLPFDPRKDIKRFEDLARFPNIVDELRNVRAEDLIPRGYGAHPDVAGVPESGGTTGVPKRVVILRDWASKMGTWMDTRLDAHGFPRNVNWLALLPRGPHMVGAFAKLQANTRGGLSFTIDMDPRWVKKLIAAGKSDEARAYVDHLIEQASFLLHSQDIGALTTTPPLLERIAQHDDLVELINRKVKGILWAGAHMDFDTRHLFRTEIFPNVKLVGVYGSTMILGGVPERPGLSDDDPSIYDPPSPFITFSIIDPDSRQPVDYGQRGQVVMNHISKNMLLPNNLERDMALRIEPPEGQVGDSVADVSPVARFGNEVVIEGVY